MTFLQQRPPHVEIADEVIESLERRGAVVALETAVVTHGLPEPANLDAVRRMEKAIRDAEATPATCLIADGRLWIGATSDQIEAAAAEPGRQKASVRDLGHALARGTTAGLTVSATLFAAAAAGIRVFATGGIGGVHAGWEGTGDVSADLAQLSRSPVITVCSGAKSVLDIPRTLEYLESLGVPVLSFRTDHFPAFYLPSSGCTAERVQDVDEVVRIAQAQWSLGYEAALVVGNPISESAALVPLEWEQWLRSARSEAEAAEVRGKDVTPFLLDRVAHHSRGRTVEANLALLEDNARLAGRIAAALSR